MEKKEKNRESLAKKLRSWQKEQTKTYQEYIKTSAVGLEFGLAIAIGALIGYFADKYFSSSPYGLLIGMLVGTLAAAKRLYVFVKSYLKKDQSDDDDK